MTNQNTNVEQAEIEKFAQHANQWWDAQGPLKTLHQVNPVRVDWISNYASLDNARLVDVGCGGGILSEALAKKGARVVGVDMAQESIEVAKRHAIECNLEIDYRVSTAETQAEDESCGFDVVVCMEMLEHVPDSESVIKSCAALVKSGGKVFFSTLNRHPKAFALSIVAAEYILNWIPKGTHSYKTFIKPSELAEKARRYGLNVVAISGIGYAPWQDKSAPFVLSENTDVNYMMVCEKL